MLLLFTGPIWNDKLQHMLQFKVSGSQMNCGRVSKQKNYPFLLDVRTDVNNGNEMLCVMQIIFLRQGIVFLLRIILGEIVGSWPAEAVPYSPFPLYEITFHGPLETG